MSKYTEAQIIKHALEYYINREGSTEQDKIKEGNLLQKYKDKVDRLKIKYRIKGGGA